MLLGDLLDALGYTQSRFYREEVESPVLSVAHLWRDAKKASVRGTYFFRTSPGEGVIVRERPAVHVAEAKTPEEAREIHRNLWSQGVNPFLIVSLPHQVRVYTGFEFNPDDDNAGLIDDTASSLQSLATIADQLG